jgi:hypothetical protein
LRRLIQLASKLYPRSWKQRYGEEFEALLEDLNPRWRDTLDVLKGAAAMQMTRWILVGAALAGTGALMAALVFYLSHHHSEQVSTQIAEAEFQRLRARFAGQSPLLDMRERRPIIDGSAEQTAAPLHTFHAMIFDTRGGQRIVRITMPYRFVRLFGGRDGFRWLGQLTFLDDTEFDPEPIQLSLNQLAQHGPGLMVDYRHASGGQFIAWAE